jgi:hypothetical protein
VAQVKVERDRDDVRMPEDLSASSDWKTLPRRALMHVGIGRRLWWRGRKRNEIDFWARWLVGAPGTEQWADDREGRLNPKTEIRDPVVRAELDRNPVDEVSILDVGAGPLTWLGYRYPGKTLTIVAVDPLAADYDRLLRDAGIEPPVRTIRVAGEDLPKHFEPASFDIAYATNSLDHSADPLTIISNMLDAVDSGQLLWNESAEVDVGAALAERAETTAWLEGHEVVARLVVR